jgi:hypothetical protein
VSGSLWQRLRYGTSRCCQRRDWPTFAGADWPERIMSLAVTDRFHAKQGRSTGRLILHAGAHRLAVYLKRHVRLPHWRGLLALLWPQRGWSPAMEEWAHLEWARREGFPVPAAVVAGEWIGPWGRLQSVLAVEELAGMLPLHEAIPRAAATLRDTEFQRWKRGLTAEVARLASELHRRRRFHRDLYLCHFYIPETSWTVSLPTRWRGLVHLIDLHRLAHHPWTAPLWQAKDLAQLLYSSEIDGVNARDRLWFWRCYRPTPRGGRLLEAAVRFRWRRYRAHNQRKQRRLAG